MNDVRTGADVSEKLKSAGTERNVLSCLFRSTEAWLSASTLLPEDWTYPFNRALWQVIDGLHSEEIPISAVSIEDRLPKEFHSELDRLGGWSFLENFREMPIDPASVVHEVKKLKALTVRRRARSAGDKLSQLATDEMDPVVLQEQAELLVNEISGPVAEEAVVLGSIGHDFIKNKMEYKGQLPGISSGMPELDIAISGFQDGRMYVVAGADKAGKSAILLNWAHHITVNLGLPVLWISTEHEPEDEYLRLLSMDSGVWMNRIENGSFQDSEEWVKLVSDSEERLAKAPFHYLPMPHFTLTKLQRAVWKYKRQHKIRIVIFDYLKLSEDKMDSKDKWSDVGMLAYGIKNLASHQHLPIITAAQINRSGIDAMRIGAEADFGHAALSHDIVRALSVGMIIRDLSKKEKEKVGFMETPHRILRIDKNRHGAANYKALLGFKADTLTLTEKERLE